MASKELQDAELLDLFEMTGVDLTDEELDDFGDKEYILYRIENELNTQFNTRKQLVLKTMYTKVSSWADLLAKTMNTAFDLDAETITDLATKDYSIPYATRIYISNDERKIRKPKQIDNSGIYFEANLSANGIISFIKDLLAKLQLDTDDFSRSFFQK